jgi:arylsulfatase A-like enzyme
MPLVVRWPARARGEGRVEEFVSLADLGPTFLEAAGLKALPEMTARSILHLVTVDPAPEGAPRRDQVFVERERHASCRADNVSYPMRAIRTAESLYIRNLEPDRWPAGEPSTSLGPGPDANRYLDRPAREPWGI